MNKYLYLYVLVFFVFTPFALSQDKDNDGVVDIFDVDDDNDGILDKYECPVTLTFTNHSPLTASTNESDLSVGDKVLYSNAITFEGVSYDIVMTINGLKLTSDNTYFDSITDPKAYIGADGNLFVQESSLTDDYVEFNFSLVELGTATMANPTGTPASIDNFILELKDIDSEPGMDITEVFGFNSGLSTSPTMNFFSANTTLHYGGFQAGQGPPAPGSGAYTFVRVNPATSGSTFDWTDEVNSNETVFNDALSSTLFLKFNTFTTVDLVFGKIDNRHYISPRLSIFGSQVICDTDNDGVSNRVDIDSDDDGIPDNVEAQPTVGYVAPGTSVDVNGMLTTYSPFTPEDTDSDGTYDFIDTDTDNDGTPDIEENGMANTVIPLDTDSDGLDDNFEGSNTNDADVNDEIDTPSSSILPDYNGDVLTGGDLDYRDVISFTESSIDFDGVDDYVTANIQMKGSQEVTMMAWIKLDDNFTNTGHILGENIFRLYVNNSKQIKLKAIIYDPNSGTDENYLISTPSLNKNQWYHVTGVYNNSLSVLKLYINGYPIISYSTSLTPNPVGGKLSTNAASYYSSFSIGRFYSSYVGSEYFKGSIDEVRVFNKALTDNQIQKMVYQEIQKQGNFVKGKVIPKLITDDDTNNTRISWNNLQAYYPMTTISKSQTSDESKYGRTAYLHNITTVQKQTAPMPFATQSAGAWDDNSSWVNGDVTGVSDMQDWSIVKLNHNTTTSSSHATSGLVIAPGAKLTVNGNNSISNSWYLQLDGTIDLQNDSQLLQGAESNLVTSATGKVLRRQEGSNSKYWYNYWASPIGAPSASSFNANENALSTNNINNTDFSLNTLKDQANTAVPFTTALDETGKLSTRWLYTFKGGTGYPGWIKLTETSGLTPGQGYCHKGTGNTSGTGNTATQQGYLFEGKPNNGTVTLDVAVSGGTLSAKYLVGNPYPSAIDAREFINDNSGIIEGTLYFWEQWAGNTHLLEEYEGGYGTVNLTATVKAYQYNDASKRGSKVPTFSIPVGQGFFVKANGTGKVVFRNSQRLFANENSGESVFMRQASGVVSGPEGLNNTDMDIIRLEFSASNGLSRELVLGFGDNTTDGYDNGYDGKMRGGLKANDICTKLDGRAMIIQAYSPLTIDREVDLVLNTTNENLLYGIKMLGNSTLPLDQDVYLKDNETGTYFNLRNNAVYNFTSNIEGEDANRFSIVFQKSQLSVNDNEATNVLVYTTTNKLFVKNLEDTSRIHSIKVIDMLGKTVKSFENLNLDALSNGLSLAQLSVGTYIVNMNFDNKTVNKKIIIK